ncbi:MAG: hypothetical protein QM709_03675 [Spongiibacteraceae bacterium]
MTQQRKHGIDLQGAINSTHTPRPAWLNHYIKNRHNYLNVLIFNCKDIHKYNDAIAHLTKLTEALFDSPIVSQTSLYDDNLGDVEHAKLLRARIQESQDYLGRGSQKSKFDWMIYVNFTAVDYQATQAMLVDHIEKTLSALPIPDYIEKINSIFHIENHVIIRHENYDPLSTAQGIGSQENNAAQKFTNYGFSKPARDAFSPKMQTEYIDWYQEVRQHDSLRANFPYETGRMWLQISAEKPFDYWCLTSYEYCAKDLDTIKKTTGAAYYAMNRYRGEKADLYQPLYEGSCIVLAEHMKPY